MTTQSKAPSPMNFGFSDDFSDLSAIQPRSTPKKETSAKKPAVPSGEGSPSPVKAKAKPVKSAPAPKRKSPKAGSKSKSKSDALAQSMGFASREASQAPVLKKRRRTHHTEPVDQLSIRGPVRVLNDFITYCDSEGVSYWEGLETLLSSQS